MPNIDVINRSRLAREADWLDALPSLQTYVDEVLRRSWGLDPIKLYFVSAVAAANPENWPVYLLDNADIADALGYHTLTDDGRPYGKVFLADDARDGLSPWVTATHEIAELAVDPRVDQVVQIGARHYAKEVADAVEADRYAVMIGRLPCSNIVLPSYFDPAAAGPYDYQRQLNSNIGLPGILPEGYLSYVAGGVSHDIMARHPETGHAGRRALRQFGRRHRRLLAPAA
jgi:hypothetical protein